MNRKEISQKLSIALNRTKLELWKMSNMTGIPIAMIYSFRSGRQLPSLESLVKLSNLLFIYINNGKIEIKKKKRMTLKEEKMVPRSLEAIKKRVLLGDGVPHYEAKTLINRIEELEEKLELKPRKESENGRNRKEA